jgi:hypothetical protein
MPRHGTPKETPRPHEVLATITPKPARRWFAVGATGLLGTILIYIAASTPPVDIAWLLFLIAMGALCLYWSWRVWTATGVALELTRTELRERRRAAVVPRGGISTASTAVSSRSNRLPDS